MVKKVFIIVCIFCLSILMVAGAISCNHKDAQGENEYGYVSGESIPEADTQPDNDGEYQDDGFGTEVDM